MEYSELIEKYNALLKEVHRLTHENRRLKAELGLKESQSSLIKPFSNESENDAFSREPHHETLNTEVIASSDSFSKIRLFMSLFKGRQDVYARRWENKRKGTSGYAPVCLNQWRSGLCGKPKTPCAKCENTSYAELNESVIFDHLSGHTVVGVYPMLPDETCFFLAMDFDKADWEKDVTIIRDVCADYAVPIAVERSRSGKGCHVWFFFEQPVSAAIARKFGTALLTCAMNRRHDIPFKSYDRLFPSQDTLPKGGLGNLIALPLQKAAREYANSVFIDHEFQPFRDQWAFLSRIEKFSQNRIEQLISELSPGHELGELKIDEENEKPWEPKCPKTVLEKTDFPEKLEIVKANMVFIPKAGISQCALNRLKRLASFCNPMFHRHQAMRLPTYSHPRVISCADETKSYLCLPRGCESGLLQELEPLGVDVEVTDKTFEGHPIQVEFKGQLRGEQNLALNCLRKHDIGILSGTTAFGKTIVAIRLIAELKRNTLILVDKVSLLNQWKDKLTEFLDIHETVPEEPKKRGRKKVRQLIGQIGAGKDTSSGIIDIAVMQSLSRKGEVRDLVKNYGLIIADECHHASAFTYEQILKTTHAKYVYGLSATPVRKDGHHPILFMQCGSVRYRDNPKKQAENRPFYHYVIPRFTPLRMPHDLDPKHMTIQRCYTEITESGFRDDMIVDDVLKNHKEGRHCLVLTLRTAHVEQLANLLKEHAPDVITLTGGMKKKDLQNTFEQITRIPKEKPIVLVATGHFIGEGFDEPRLDTLFLAMPISWKGTLQQYAGRLHRLFNTKKEVRIYDYADIQISMLERMYQKRLNGYAGMGYKIKGNDLKDSPPDIIFTKDNFLTVFNQDIVSAKKEIVIVSPFIRQKRTRDMIRNLSPATRNRIHITIITRPKEDFPERDHDSWQKAMDLLSETGFSILFKPNIHQKFALMDRKTVWYGSINLMSYGTAQESMMRIESAQIANELMKGMDSD